MRKSIFVQFNSTKLTNQLMDSLDARSSCEYLTSTFLYLLVMQFAVYFILDLSRAPMIILHPWAAKPIAVSLPIPVFPPVITATFPLRLYLALQTPPWQQSLVEIRIAIATAATPQIFFEGGFYQIEQEIQDQIVWEGNWKVKGISQSQLYLMISDSQCIIQILIRKYMNKIHLHPKPKSKAIGLYLQKGGSALRSRSQFQFTDGNSSSKMGGPNIESIISLKKQYQSQIKQQLAKLAGLQNQQIVITPFEEYSGMLQLPQQTENRQTQKQSPQVEESNQKSNEQYIRSYKEFVKWYREKMFIELMLVLRRNYKFREKMQASKYRAVETLEKKVFNEWRKVSVSEEGRKQMADKTKGAEDVYRRIQLGRFYKLAMKNVLIRKFKARKLSQAIKTTLCELLMSMKNKQNLVINNKNIQKYRLSKMLQQWKEKWVRNKISQQKTHLVQRIRMQKKLINFFYRLKIMRAFSHFSEPKQFDSLSNIEHYDNCIDSDYLLHYSKNQQILSNQQQLFLYLNKYRKSHTLKQWLKVHRALSLQTHFFWKYTNQFLSRLSECKLQKLFVEQMRSKSQSIKIVIIKQSLCQFCKIVTLSQIQAIKRKKIQKICYRYIIRNSLRTMRRRKNIREQAKFMLQIARNAYEGVQLKKSFTCLKETIIQEEYIKNKERKKSDISSIELQYDHVIDQEAVFTDFQEGDVSADFKDKTAAFMEKLSAYFVRDVLRIWVQKSTLRRSNLLTELLKSSQRNSANLFIAQLKYQYNEKNQKNKLLKVLQRKGINEFVRGLKLNIGKKRLLKMLNLQSQERFLMKLRLNKVQSCRIEIFNRIVKQHQIINTLKAFNQQRSTVQLKREIVTLLNKRTKIQTLNKVKNYYSNRVIFKQKLAALEQTLSKYKKSWVVCRIIDNIIIGRKYIQFGNIIIKLLNLKVGEFFCLLKMQELQKSLDNRSNEQGNQNQPLRLLNKQTPGQNIHENHSITQKHDSHLQGEKYLSYGPKLSDSQSVQNINKSQGNEMVLGQMEDDVFKFMSQKKKNKNLQLNADIISLQSSYEGQKDNQIVGNDLPMFQVNNDKDIVGDQLKEISEDASDSEIREYVCRKHNVKLLKIAFGALKALKYKDNCSASNASKVVDKIPIYTHPKSQRQQKLIDLKIHENQLTQIFQQKRGYNQTQGSSAIQRQLQKCCQNQQNYPNNATMQRKQLIQTSIIPAKCQIQHFLWQNDQQIKNSVTAKNNQSLQQIDILQTDKQIQKQEEYKKNINYQSQGNPPTKSSFVVKEDNLIQKTYPIKANISEFPRIDYKIGPIQKDYRKQIAEGQRADRLRSAFTILRNYTHHRRLIRMYLQQYDQLVSYYPQRWQQQQEYNALVKQE